MPELTYLRAWISTLINPPATEDDRPNDAGDIVQYVVITAALALAAVAIVAIIVTKIKSKASGLSTE
jgi:hypothetical protein